MSKLNLSLPKELCPDELLLRAVLPVDRMPSFWHEDGTLSSAALKIKNGLSVDRTYNRSLSEAIDFLLSHLSGHVVSISQDDCKEVNAFIEYSPTEEPPENPFHCNIFGDSNKKSLNNRQAKILAGKAKLVYAAYVTTS